jgi:hypothetical protein
MDEISKYVELLEQRVSLLRELARQFVDSRKALLAMDLDRIYGDIAVAEDLCRRIRAIDSAIVSLRKTRADHLGPGTPNTRSAGLSGAPAFAGRLRAVLAAMTDTQREVHQLNQIHAAYLRRCGRTIDLFANFFRSHSLIYAIPQGSRSAAAAARSC